MARISLRALLLVLGLLTTFGVSRAQTREAPAVANVQAPADENAALLARSQALSAEERERARGLFSTGFTLWQAGDFAAAEIPFAHGLEIDPANAPANFYLANCLERRGENSRALSLYDRVLAFAPESPEAYRAQAARDALAARLPPTTSEAMRAALIGHWEMEGADGAPDPRFSLDVTGFVGAIPQAVGHNPYVRFRNLTIEGDRIVVEFRGAGRQEFYFVSSTRLEQRAPSCDLCVRAVYLKQR